MKYKYWLTRCWHKCFLPAAGEEHYPIHYFIPDIFRHQEAWMAIGESPDPHKRDWEFDWPYCQHYASGNIDGVAIPRKVNKWSVYRRGAA